MMQRLTIGLALTVLALAGCKKDQEAAPKLKPKGPLTKASGCDPLDKNCLPEVEFADSGGEIWTREALIGNVVVVNFWADWCGPCKKEIPAFSRVYDRNMDQGLVVLGVQRDWKGDRHLQQFMKANQMTYPVVVSDDNVEFSFGYPSQIPKTFIYDRKGNLQLEHIGTLTEQQLEDLVAPLLAQKG